MKAALLFALPWVLLPFLALLRLRGTRLLSQYPATPPTDAPRVSVIIPARNEAANIGRCVSSVLTSDWPALEVLVVDDHSTDETAAIVRAIATRDPRLRLIAAPPLPAGWFGKQWACQTAADQAQGDWLLFTDADTWHARDCLPRMMAFRAARQAQVVSVGLRLEMKSFWEWLVQPPVFFTLLARIGGTDAIANARRAEDSATNGQYTLYSRAVYDAVGGHAAVRHNVAEDLLLGQAVWRAGYRVHLVLALTEGSVRMYTSLRTLVDGWSKNVYAGGKYAMPPGTPRWAYFALVGALPAVMLTPPLLALLFALGVIGGAAGLGGAIAYGVLTAMMAALYLFERIPLWAAPLWPLGVAMAGYIFARAVRRGDRVEWKGRAYDSR